MGYASQVIILYGSITYIVILAWAFLYLFSSFTVILPWASCNNSWNTGTLHAQLKKWHNCNCHSTKCNNLNSRIYITFKRNIHRFLGSTVFYI